MRLTCPACHAEMSLDALVGREADVRAMAGFIRGNVALGVVLVNYIALFRPAKRRLSMARTVALFDELLPDLQRGAIARKGRDWPAPQALWEAAIAQVLAARDKGALTLPLASHGYLYEVLAGMADKAEAVAEREREQGLRNRPAQGQALPVLAATATAAASAAPAPLPYDPARGPSRAARELRARMAAAQAARQGTDDGGQAAAEGEGA